MTHAALLHDSSGLRTAPTRWEILVSEFLACHRSGHNVAIHLVTTPIGLVAILSMAWHFSTALATAIAAAYSIAILFVVPVRIWLATTAVISALIGTVAILEPGVGLGLLLFGFAYGFQEVAHYVAGEPTLQSTYLASRLWLIRLAEHTFFLLPLVLASIRHAVPSPLETLVPKRMVFKTKLEAAEECADMNRILEFVESENPPLTHTTHWWQEELSVEVRESFARLAEASPIREMIQKAFGDSYVIEALGGMNEIYVTGPPQEVTSDNVFYTPHIDGPFPVYPFCTVFRCMLAISRNERVRTHFPMEDEVDFSGYTLSSGDALAFDFHREPHYITNGPGKPTTDRRVSLKLHYVAYPKGLRRYGQSLGKLTTWYDKRARQLFLDTLTPKRTWDKFKASWVLWTTKVFEHLERVVGCNNLAYVLVLAALSACFSKPSLFLLGTSYVHYLLYIATFANRKNVAYGRFLRNVVFFKTLALAQLVACYLYFFEWNLLSLGMIVSGFGLATIACARLGTLRTYFGVELGRCAPLKIQAFPYNVLPHPMILGSIVGLVGFGILPEFREHIPWLIPLHVLFYLGHLAQEIHRRGSSAGAPRTLRRKPHTTVH